MLPQLSAAVRVFLCTRPTDLRKGFDGLSGLVQECFSQDLLTGHLFLFLNRRRDRIKILYFDRDGLVIWYKRLESGSFQIHPSPAATRPAGSSLRHRPGLIPPDRPATARRAVTAVG
jgi:transposase